MRDLNTSERDQVEAALRDILVANRLTRLEAKSLTDDWLNTHSALELWEALSEVAARATSDEGALLTLSSVELPEGYAVQLVVVKHVDDHGDEGVGR